MYTEYRKYLSSGVGALAGIGVVVGAGTMGGLRRRMDQSLRKFMAPDVHG